MNESLLKRQAALLWDESHLWAVMALAALDEAALPCAIVTADEVRQGALDRYDLLFVPGGWASLKIKKLGAEGAEAIRRFVRDGGTYFGICGGAGLGLDVKDGLSLLPVSRKPTAERVPSFAGGIRVKRNATGNDSKTFWPFPRDEEVFHAWWPSQFSIGESAPVHVLARYGRACDDAYSSDLPVAELSASPGAWKNLEEAYGILLDPARLEGEPAVISGRLGEGRVILSMLHFDTPGDSNGGVMLRRIWEAAAIDRPDAPLKETPLAPATSGKDPLLDRAASLMDLGERHFLWRWRNDFLTQWRRGVRGLEFCTLYVVSRAIAARLEDRPAAAPGLGDRLQSASRMFAEFAGQAGLLLVLERLALQRGTVTFNACDDPEIAALRGELFGRAKSHGGRYKTLLDHLDGILLDLMRRPSRSA